MAILNGNNFQDFSTVYNAIFDEVFQGDTKSANNYEKWCRVDSKQGLNYEFDFLSDYPTFREWSGKKVFKNTRANTFRIPTKDYEASTMVSKLEFVQEPTLVGSKLRTWSSGARGLVNKLVVEKLITGNTALGYDGVAFFGASHAGEDGSTQSNYSADALSQTSLRTAITAMRAFTDTRGRNLGVEPTKLIVGPKNSILAMELTGAKYRLQGMTAGGVVDAAASIVAAGAIDNVLSDIGIEVIVEPNLKGTSDDYWFLVGEVADGKPFIANMAQAPNPTTDADGQYIAGSPAYKVSVEAQLSLGFGLWQCMVGNFAG